MDAALPEITTARLALHRHRPEDFAECAALWGDPEVTRHIGGRPLTEEEVWTRLLRYIGHWSVLGFGYWVARERTTGRYVGDVGFANLKRDVRPPLGEAPEIGWVLACWAHGQGFATEAARAAIDWGEVHFGPRTTVCIIDPDNTASIRVAEKCGYQLVERARYRGEPVLSFVRAAHNS